MIQSIQTINPSMQLLVLYCFHQIQFYINKDNCQKYMIKQNEEGSKDDFNVLSNGMALNLNLPIGQITVYLPGYLRLKFKNFVSLDLKNLSGQMNATMIYNIYYSNLLEQLRAYGATKEDEERLLHDMQNKFLINFAKDDAILLSEGKKYKKRAVDDKKKPQSKKQEAEPKEAKIKRNIELNVKHEVKQKMIKFTMRKNFTVHLKSSVFWSPFQNIDSILEITLQSLKFQFGGNNKVKVSIEINLMDTENTIAKVSYSESKKFGQYGIVLSGLDAIYSNKKMVVGQPIVFEETAIKLQKRLEKEKDQRFLNDYKMVMDNKDYDQYKVLYQKEYNSKKDKYEKTKEGETKKNSQPEKLSAQIFGKQLINEVVASLRKFKWDQKLDAYHYASFKIPLYKLPFTSLATIFLPLWLLAVLNLGIFFQATALSDRIAAIASLALAFIAFIPTIRDQIPPSPNFVLVEILVYLVVGTSLLALGQSIQIHQLSQSKFDWQSDALFLISLSVDILVFVIVVTLLIIHYCRWQPRYKTELKGEGKFERKFWWNRQCEKEFRIKYAVDQYKKGRVAGKQHHLFEVIDTGVKKGAKLPKSAIKTN